MMSLPRYLLLGTLVLGCGRIRFDPMPLELVVEHAYPVYGAGWNDYVMGSDAPCPYATVLTEHFHDTCIHGGEMLVVRVPRYISCGGLTFGDVLGAFDWVCDDADGVTLRTRGLRHDVRLAALLEPDRWANNQVLVHEDGELVGMSQPAAWWSNPVVPLPDNTASLAILDQPGTMYTLAASRATAGYHIAADGVAIVSLDDAVLSFNGSALNCDTSPISTDILLDPDRRCILSAGYVNRLWIEGAFDGNGPARADLGVYLSVVAFSVLRYVRAYSLALDGVYITSTYSTLVDELVVYNNDRRGFYDLFSEYAIERDIVTANNGDEGMRVYDGGPWRITNVRAVNNGNHGVAFDFDALGVMTNVLAANNMGDGVDWQNVDLPQTTVHRVLSINNAKRGFAAGSLYGAMLSHVVAINNGANGVDAATGDAPLLAQLVSANNAGTGFFSSSLSNTLYQGNIVVGTNMIANCNVTGGTQPGIDNTCQSAARLVTGVDARGSFVGSTPGAVTASTITAWADPHSLVTWGPDTAALDVTARGRCVSCRPWDYSLAAADAVLRDAARTGSPVPEPFVPGAICPPGVQGDRVVYDPDTNCSYDDWPGSCHRTYLLDAIEIDDDYIGNDDGLCESDEACLYAPSFGIDYGSGPLVGPCVFEDGKVHGVTMYGR